MRHSAGELWKAVLTVLVTVGGVGYIVLGSVFAGRVGKYERALDVVLEPFIPGWLPGAIPLALGVALMATALGG